MVCVGVPEERGVRQSMAMVPDRSKPLHNFTLPCLKWGIQKHLRCKKLIDSEFDDSCAVQRSPAPKLENYPANRQRESETETPVFFKDSEKKIRIARSVIQRTNSSDDCGADDGIEAIREKLMFDLKTATEKMEVILREEEEKNADGDEESLTLVSAVAAPPELRPWNLRTMRAACKAPTDVGDGGGAGDTSKSVKIGEKKPNQNSPLKSCDVMSQRLREEPEKKKRPKFAVPLSKKEIEEDFMALMGRRPLRRPKKRPRIVQKQLDTLFPGLWLTEVTADMYKVEFPENGKR